MVSQHKIIFFNGPPKSGKDLAANTCAYKINRTMRTAKFSWHLKMITKKIFDLSDDRYFDLEAEGNNDKKDIPLPELHGMSWREALIWVSEEVMKPKFGKRYFGEVLTKKLAVPTATIGTAISDVGFSHELTPVIKQFGPANCHLVQLHRDGCDFTNDSRGYIDLIDLEIELPKTNFHIINNNHDIDLFGLQMVRLCNKIYGVAN